MAGRQAPIRCSHEQSQSVHALGSRAKVLLTSVFGPYAQDDQYGSHKMNPMELYHNQVTRVQGPFSLRMFHRSWGLMFIQANLHASCTLLDFPTRDRFLEEIRDNHYDVVGISGIMSNVLKVQEMCRLVRHHLPQRGHRRRRTRGQHARSGPAHRRRPHRARRRRAVVPGVPGRESRPTLSASGHHFRHQHAEHGTGLE